MVPGADDLSASGWTLRLKRLVEIFVVDHECLHFRPGNHDTQIVDIYIRDDITAFVGQPEYVRSERVGGVFLLHTDLLFELNQTLTKLVIAGRQAHFLGDSVSKSAFGR